MNIILFDNPHRQNLFPLAFTNAVGELRLGIFTNRERWGLCTKAAVYLHTDDYLQPRYDAIPAEKSLWVDACLMADSQLRNTILSLDDNTALADETGFIAGMLNIAPADFRAAKVLQYFQNTRQQCTDTRK